MLVKANTFRVFFFFLLVVCLAPLSGRADDDRVIELSVAKNDNLINLCKKYLAEPSRWPEIGRINRLKDFDLIHPGQTLIIPVRLLNGVPLDGRALFVKGDVTVRDSEGQPWRVLEKESLVHQGSVIRTGRESAVEIAFEDGASFFQRPDTTLSLNATHRKAGRYLFQSLFLQAGRILMNIRRATGRELRIEILTPSAAAVARGTDFRVSVDTDAMTSEVLHGIVDVEAMKQVVVVKEGEGTVVNKGQPPLKPRKLLPPPTLPDLLPLYKTMPFSLKPGDVEGAAAFRFRLSMDPEGRDVIREKMVGIGESLELSGLEDGTYYLTVQSIDAVGLEGLPNGPYPIRVRINPLPPFIQEPADGMRVRGKAVSFRWMKVRDAAGYDFEVSSDLEFRDSRQAKAVLQGESHDLAFADFGTYCFRVRSRAADGYEGIWSDVITFNLIPPPPSPAMEKPALEEKELRIRWRNQGDKMRYRCQVARDEGFGNPILEQVVERPEVALSKPTDPGIYYVRTSTIDPTGYEGGFSPPQTFEIIKPKPVEPKPDHTGTYILGASFVGLIGLLFLVLP